MAPPAPRPSRSARAQAQRPQLVPRASRAKAESPDTADPDVASVSERTPDVAEWDALVHSGAVAGVMATPEPEPKPNPALAPQLSLTPSTIHDIDQLWDWCREDPTGTQAFLGFTPSHSRALQDYVGKLLLLEQNGKAWLRTIMVDGHALGFISMLPVHRDVAEPYGDAHCYLMPALQGHLAELLPSILAEGSRQEPTLTFRVFTSDYAFARLLQPHGFTLNIVLTRPASAAQNR